MTRVTDDQLGELFDAATKLRNPTLVSLVTELRERRAAEVTGMPDNIYDALQLLIRGLVWHEHSNGRTPEHLSGQVRRAIRSLSPEIADELERDGAALVYAERWDETAKPAPASSAATADQGPQDVPATNAEPSTDDHKATFHLDVAFDEVQKAKMRLTSAAFTLASEQLSSIVRMAAKVTDIDELSLRRQRGDIDVSVMDDAHTTATEALFEAARMLVRAEDTTDESSWPSEPAVVQDNCEQGMACSFCHSRIPDVEHQPDHRRHAIVFQETVVCRDRCLPIVESILAKWSAS